MNDKYIDKLVECANLEETEIGEMWTFLVRLYDYKSYMSKEFVQALEREIKANVEYIEEHTEIVEEEYTTTRKVRNLEWL